MLVFLLLVNKIPNSIPDLEETSETQFSFSDKHLLSKSSSILVFKAKIKDKKPVKCFPSVTHMVDEYFAFLTHAPCAWISSKMRCGHSVRDTM